MRSKYSPVAPTCAVGLALSGCADVAKLTVLADTGANPALPSPHTTLIPTGHTAPAKGWTPGETPRAVMGTPVAAHKRL